MNNKVFGFTLLIAGILLFPEARCADAALHSKVAVGMSFQITTDWGTGGRSAAKYSWRYDVITSDMDGYIMITAKESVDSATGKPGKTEDHFALEKDACVVDVANALALLHGAQCAQPLPKNWITKDRGGEARDCKSKGTENINVPAGKFSTTKIECRLEASAFGNQRTVTYWYAESLGIMVKVVDTSAGSAIAPAIAISNELESYQLK